MNRWAKISFWLLPVILFVLQAIYTFSATNQVRVEELNDSVRDVYWMQYGELFTYRPKNIGWYAPLLMIYNFFGFHLFTAKIFKLVLDLAALFCLAALLRKFLGEKKGWLPMVTIGLSPTLLYYTMLGIPVGVDFQYLLICLYFLLTLNLKNSLTAIFKQFCLGLITFIAVGSYPVFLFLTPSLLIFYIHSIFKQTKLFRVRFQNVLYAGVGLLLPFLSILIYMKDKKALLNGEGFINGTANLKFDLGVFLARFQDLLGHLFIAPNNGYYYEVKFVEFSFVLPFITVLLVCFTTFSLVRKKQFRLPVYLALLVVPVNLLFGCMTTDIEVGLRRFTPIIAAFYLLYIFSWHFVFHLKKGFKKYIFFTVLLILPIHHMLIYIPNLNFLSQTRHFAEQYWFIRAQIPVESLDLYLDELQKKDLDITCVNSKKEPVSCRYDIIFSAIEGSCIWNKLTCHNLYAFDPKLGYIKKLSIHSGI